MNDLSTFKPKLLADSLRKSSCNHNPLTKECCKFINVETVMFKFSELICRCVMLELMGKYIGVCVICGLLLKCFLEVYLLFWGQGDVSKCPNELFEIRRVVEMYSRCWVDFSMKKYFMENLKI